MKTHEIPAKILASIGSECFTNLLSVNFYRNLLKQLSHEEIIEILDIKISKIYETLHDTHKTMETEEFTLLYGDNSKLIISCALNNAMHVSDVVTDHFMKSALIFKDSLFDLKNTFEYNFCTLSSIFDNKFILEITHYIVICDYIQEIGLLDTFVFTK